MLLSKLIIIWLFDTNGECLDFATYNFMPSSLKYYLLSCNPCRVPSSMGQGRTRIHEEGWGYQRSGVYWRLRNGQALALQYPSLQELLASFALCSLYFAAHAPPLTLSLHRSPCWGDLRLKYSLVQEVLSILVCRLLSSQLFNNMSCRNPETTLAAVKCCAESVVVCAASLFV